MEAQSTLKLLLCSNHLTTMHPPRTRWRNLGKCPNNSRKLRKSMMKPRKWPIKSKTISRKSRKKLINSMYRKSRLRVQLQKWNQSLVYYVSLLMVLRKKLRKSSLPRLLTIIFWEEWNKTSFPWKSNQPKTRTLLRTKCLYWRPRA